MLETEKLLEKITSLENELLTIRNIINLNNTNINNNTTLINLNNLKTNKLSETVANLQLEVENLKSASSN